MAEEVTFYNYERQYQLLLSRIYPEKYFCKTISNKGFRHKPYNLTLANKQIIDKYRIFLENQGGKTIARRKRILQLVSNIGELLQKDFEIAKKEDIEQLVSKIMNYSGWNETTKSMHKQNLKSFYKWLKGNSEFFPPEVSWVKVIKTKGSQKLPSEMLTADEVVKILEAADHPMKKVLISLLWETGARIGELGTVKLKSIQFDGTEATIMLDGKTGMRQVLLISSVPFIREWLTIHPRKSDKEAPLFVIVSNVHRGERLSYPSIHRMLREITQKAGVDNRFIPIIGGIVALPIWQAGCRNLIFAK